MISDGRVQAYGSLAFILWLPSVARLYKCKITDSVPFDANQLLMTKLREGLVASEWMTLDTVQAKYIVMRLWALYGGAYAEQTQLVVVGTGLQEDISKNWFKTKFVEQARSMGLISWDKARERIMRILYTDVLTPYPLDWFAEITDERILSSMRTRPETMPLSRLFQP
jgi:hypothetical protein